jgi:hypothetical protein
MLEKEGYRNEKENFSIADLLFISIAIDSAGNPDN